MLCGKRLWFVVVLPPHILVSRSPRGRGLLIRVPGVVVSLFPCGAFYCVNLWLAWPPHSLRRCICLQVVFQTLCMLYSSSHVRSSLVHLIMTHIQCVYPCSLLRMVSLVVCLVRGIPCWFVRRLLSHLRFYWRYRWIWLVVCTWYDVFVSNCLLVFYQPFGIVERAQLYPRPRFVVLIVSFPLFLQVLFSPAWGRDAYVPLLLRRGRIVATYLRGSMCQFRVGVLPSLLPHF